MKGPVRLIFFVGAISLGYTQANQKVAGPAFIQPDQMLSESADNTTVRVDTMSENIEDIKYEKYNIVTNPGDSPTINPVIVYSAILLLIVAAFLQLLNVFVFKKDIAWIVFFLIAAGFIAALFWGRNFQPHSEGLVRRAALVLEMQENWALWTVRTAFLAIILQMVHLFVTKFEKAFVSNHHKTAIMINRRNRILMSLVMVIMLSSAFCMVRAENLGSKLVHTDMPGPQEKFIFR